MSEKGRPLGGKMGEGQNVKVSIIIYVKNTVDYIEQCVRSVMNQTLQEIEIFVVDGGSTDGTLEIIEGLKKEDDRIRIRYTHSSVGAQFNLGLKEARGEYIGLCEADDYLLPDMYQKQYEIAKENQLDVLRAGYYQVCTKNNAEYRFPLKACWKKEMTEKVIQVENGMFFLEQGMNGFWNGIYRRQFLTDNHIWMNETKGAAHQDITFSFFAQLYARKIWFMEEAFYCYRIDNPFASANSLNGIKLHIREYEELRKRLVGAGMWEPYKNLFFSWELVSYKWFLGELPKRIRNEKAEEVYQCLKKQAEENGFRTEYVWREVEDLAKKLYCGKSDFIQYFMLDTKERERLQEYITGSFKEDKYVILFGIGHIGKLVHCFLKMCKKEVLLTDNSEWLQTMGFMGEKVYHPEEAVKKFPHGNYIVANITYAEQMRTQLFKLGIQRENVFLCDNEDFFLRKIFVKEE